MLVAYSEPTTVGVLVAVWLVHMINSHGLGLHMPILQIENLLYFSLLFLCLNKEVE